MKTLMKRPVNSLKMPIDYKCDCAVGWLVDSLTLPVRNSTFVSCIGVQIEPYDFTRTGVARRVRLESYYMALGYDAPTLTIPMYTKAKTDFRWSYNKKSDSIPKLNLGKGLVSILSFDTKTRKHSDNVYTSLLKKYAYSNFNLSLGYTAQQLRYADIFKQNTNESSPGILLSSTLQGGWSQSPEYTVTQLRAEHVLRFTENSTTTSLGRGVTSDYHNKGWLGEALKHAQNVADK